MYTHFITEQDRSKGTASAIVSVRRGEAVFNIVSKWVPPKPGRPHVYRSFITANLRKPFQFNVVDMPVEEWDRLIQEHGKYLHIRR